METRTLDEHLQRQVDAGSSGLDIMHGHLKTLIFEAQQELEEAQRIRKRTTTQTLWNPWSANIGRDK